MTESVDAHRAGRLGLRKLVNDLQGLMAAADLHDQALINEFWNHEAPIDMELELRTEDWAPPGSASDEALDKRWPTSGVGSRRCWRRQTMSGPDRPDLPIGIAMQERTSRGVLRCCRSVFGCQTQREDVALGVGHVGEDDAGLDFARMSDNLAASTEDRFASERQIIDDEVQSGAATRIVRAGVEPQAHASDT